MSIKSFFEIAEMTELGEQVYQIVEDGNPQGKYIIIDVDALAQLRADLQAAQQRIAWLTCDIGEDGLAAINRLIAACERGDIAQQYTPDLSIARDEILRQARQLDAARKLRELAEQLVNSLGYWMSAEEEPQECLKAELALGEWLAANPAPEADQASDNDDAWIDSYAKAALRIDRPQS